MNKKLSIIVPCYNEEESIPIFYEEILKIQEEIQVLEFEFIFIDDGSVDDTLRVIKKLHEKDERVRYRSFSRNFGKEAAIYAGLSTSSGDYMVTMDVDLQDPPNLLPQMFEWIEKGYDCVATRRSSRKGEPLIRSFFARLFYRIMKKISQAEIMDGARDYRMMTKQVSNAICEMKEYNRFLKGIYGWVGFKTKWIEYENIERKVGKTKWSFGKLFIYSIEGIVAFSTAPLVAVSVIGLILFFTAMLLLCVIIIKALTIGDPVAGWPSMVCIITLLGGIQLMCLGIVGLYLSKMYLETKQRPIFIVKEEV